MYVTQWTNYVQATTHLPSVLCDTVLEFIGVDLKCVLIMMLAQSENMEILLPVTTSRLGVRNIIIRVEIPQRRIDTMTDKAKRETIVVTKQISVRTSRKARSSSCHYKAPHIDVFWNDIETCLLTNTSVFRRMGYKTFESDLIRFISANWKDSCKSTE